MLDNWDLHRPASFCSLRANGTFLLDAACADGTVSSVAVHGECGGDFRMKNPWSAASNQQSRVYEGDVISIPMEQGETILLTGIIKF